MNIARYLRGAGGVGSGGGLAGGLGGAGRGGGLVLPGLLYRIQLVQLLATPAQGGQHLRIQPRFNRETT